MQILSDKVQRYILQNLLTDDELLVEHDELETYVEFALRIGVTNDVILNNARNKDKGGI